MEINALRAELLQVEHLYRSNKRIGMPSTLQVMIDLRSCMDQLIEQIESMEAK